MSNGDKTLSKFLSLILRHKPQTIGLALDGNGWASVAELITKANSHNVPLTLDNLKRIVDINDKKRFQLSKNGELIRASQGHSIEVDLQLKEAKPLDVLFHGTATRNIESIKAQGILKRKRHHVHLSQSRETALQVGTRHGKPLIIRVDAKRMHAEGYTFYLSQNGVWLIDHVPPLYLQFE